MRRALITLLVALVLAPAFVYAQGLNFKDQKSVQAEIDRRINEKLKEYQPQVQQQELQAQKQRAELERLLQQTPVQNAPAVPAPAIECKVSGCSNELCMPAVAGTSSGVAGTCQYLTFYGCYKNAACVKAIDPATRAETCKWQDTAELRSCLQSKGGEIALTHAGILKPAVPAVTLPAMPR